MTTGDQLIAWAGLTAQPWRNGGGVTREILSRRSGESGEWVPATADDWDWRLSIADVNSAGPFSSFPGMTRILTVIEGTSVTLTVDGVGEQLERHRPFRFDGGVATSAELPHGSIRDLNLIARAGVADASVIISARYAERPQPVAEWQYCVLLDGHAVLRSPAPASSGSGKITLAPYDTILGDVAHRVTITGAGTIAMIAVRPQS